MHHIRCSGLMQIQGDLADNGTCQHGADAQDTPSRQVNLHTHTTGCDKEHVIGFVALADKHIVGVHFELCHVFDQGGKSRMMANHGC